MQDNAIIESLVLIKLKISSWTSKRENRREARELETNRGAANGTVSVKAEYLEEKYRHLIGTAASHLRSFFNDHTLPWMDGGYRIVPVEKYQSLMDSLAQVIREEWEPAVLVLSSSYDAIKLAAQSRLSELYDPANFPAPGDFAGSYAVDIQRSAVQKADDARIAGMSESALAEIRDSIRAQQSEALSKATESLIKRVREMMMEIIDRVSRDKKGTHYKSLWSNLRALVAVLPQLNINGDPRITKAVDNINERIARWPAEYMRQSKSARDTVATAAAGILQDLNSTVSSASVEVE